MKNNRTLAKEISEAIQLAGYDFDGTTVSINWNPTFKQRVICGNAIYVPSKEEIKQNEKILSSAPIGAEVIFETRMNGYRAVHGFRKTDRREWEPSITKEEYLKEE